jgi:hypothetical protein
MATGKRFVPIGSGGWEEKLRAQGAELDPAFWAGFKPAPASEIERIERSLQRTLPEDFKLFLRHVGSGNFPWNLGGGIFTPDEIIVGCSGPLWMLKGSSGWATEDEHRRFYATRGAENPNPAKFTRGVTMHGDIDLLDLVQIGDDGLGCYYQLVCPPLAKKRLGFCKITPSEKMEDCCASFSEGLHNLMVGFREWQED